jgi:flagellar basal-body rod protein FlgC
MIDPLQAASRLAAGGLEAQAMRLRVVSENVANVRSTGSAEGADPYARKTVTFETVYDRELGASAVQIKRVGVDDAPFLVEHDPGNPAADADGNVKLPNVNMLIELADMREASRTYEANLQMMKQTRSMVAMTIDLLRSQG